MKRESIRIKSLSIGYTGIGDVKVVNRNINADIYECELTCLLGVNGVGKSTLLRTLSAFQPKIEGEIWIQGKEIGTYSDHQLSHIIGVVLTERPTVRNMTAEELIGLGRNPHTGFWGKLSKRDKEIIKRAIEQVNIETICHRMIHTLSDGERQKVMIAKALAQETPVIFLDEPTAFLDYPSKVEIMHLLHKLSHEVGKTIFLSTHDLDLALQMADKLWIMDKKEGVMVGTPEDLSLNGTLSTFFANGGILFDSETGLFRTDHVFSHELRLIGEGQKYAMARKALSRNGILADREIKSDCYIDTGEAEDDQGFVIHLSTNKQITVTSIEGMLEVVGKYIVN